MGMFRYLNADEIEARVATVNEYGVTLLLYKDARCDMRILDETVGAFNWQRMHTRDNANCTVLIKNTETGEWIGKEDTGTESNTEAQKGLASDSFKRACFNWGIGRELYTAPQIKIPANSCEVKQKNGRFYCYDRFYVEGINYDKNGNIDVLAIRNENTGKRVFTYNTRKDADEVSRES